MLNFLWPLCAIWVCVITHARSQSESNVNYFEILKSPTELAGYEFHKNSLRLCKGDDAAVDDDARRTNSPPDDAFEHQYNAFLLKMFTNIAQQLRQRPCGNSKSSTRMSTTTVEAAAAAVKATAMAGSTIKPAAKTMASLGRSLRVYYKAQRPPQEQEDLEGTFNILDQLKLDEKEQHKLKLQSQQGQDGHKQQLTGLPQAFWEEPTFEPLGKAGKKKKKKKKKKRKKRKRKKKPPKDKNKRRKKNPNLNPTLVGQPAHVLFAQQSPIQFQHEHDHPATLPLPLPLTTKKPHHHFTPIKKIKYILRKNTIFKKKKKEYLNHLKHVLYPFVKFIAFFTVLNPFTLAVFLFSLLSPVVFGVIGFIGLSFLIKPALSLLFGVKRTVSSINRKNLLEKRRREHLRNSQRPITIHKHYYQQTWIPRPAPQLQHHKRRRPYRQRQSPRPKYKPNAHQHHQRLPRHSKHFNPLLPYVRHKLKRDTTSLFGLNFLR